jgi:multiple sugar transport system substrate-binding protein
MKILFFVLFSVLTVAGLALYFTRPEAIATSPVIHLIGSPGPETQHRINGFRDWLKETGNDDVDLRIDAGNADKSKIILQCISGIGADLLPSNLGADLHYLKAMGITRDITESARAKGFGPESFAEVAREEILIDGRQYAYPTLLYVLMNYANIDTFEALGMEPPPARMSFEEFETIGREFVKRANPPGSTTRRFFANAVTPLTMGRSLGLDTFNETMTRCTLEDPRYAQVLDLIHRWTFADRLLPSATDLSSFASNGSTAAAFGPRLYQFWQGNLGIIAGGNYLVYSLRQLGKIRLAVLEPPNGGFPNAVFGATMLSVYAGSKHPEAAESYLQYLASPGYARRVMETGGGIPANLELARDPDFLRPPEYPNEWGCNERFVQALEEIGIPYTASPFVLFSVYNRISDEAFERFMAGRSTAEEAGRRAATAINEEIARTLHEQPELQARYDELTARQREIEARRARGEKVPLAWITNPFHRRYYQAMGWTE